MTVELDDWVRFYRDGELVIGVVQYVRLDLLQKVILSTTAGEVSEDNVLEIRKRPEQE